MATMFIACCITILCCAPIEIGVYVVDGGAGCTRIRVERQRSSRDGVGPCGSMTVVTGAYAGSVVAGDLPVQVWCGF